MSFWNAIGAGISALGGLAGNAMNRAAIREQNKANKELAKYQYDLNMEAWNKQNEYNTPYQQVARLRAAGLNPQLAYGNGTQAGNASAAPTYEAPHMEAYQGNARDLSQALSSVMTFKQIEQVEALTKASEAQSRLYDEQAREKFYENKLAEKRSEYAVEFAALEYDLKHNQVLQASNLVDKTQQEYLNLQESGQAIKLDNQLRNIRLLYEDNMQQAQLDQIRKHAEQLGASAEHFKALVSQIKSLTPAQLDLIEQQFKNLEQEYNILGPTENMAEDLGISPQMASFFKILISLFK